MGQGQSSGSQSHEERSSKKTSYYVLLEVEKSATEDELKKAYRRKALELHPDRNHGREDEVIDKFTEVQAAYDVLSDPQERAWYDSHETAILSGVDPSNDVSYAYDIKITTTDDIMSAMSAFHGKKVDYDHVPDKFFTELGTLFDTLADEEVKAASMEGSLSPELMPFGRRSDDYDDIVKPFYNSWTGFSTRKSYAWVDKYRMSDADDRRMRRAIEKENKKFRDDAIREFNDAVRMLVTFVRKRDPRYKPNFQSEQDRQKELREKAKLQAAKSRAENEKRLAGVIPDWAQSKDQDSTLVGSFDDDDEEEIIHHECVVCNKVFKSEKQYESHEQSKKHKQAVKDIVRQMRKEDRDFNLDSVETKTSNPLDMHSEDEGQSDESDLDLSDRLESLEVENESLSHEKESVDDEAISESDNTVSDDEYTPREQVIDQTTPPPEPIEQQPAIKQPKMGKAAQKRARRAAAAAEEELQFKCSQCDAEFPTRNRLFQHIEKLGHAAPVGNAKTNVKAKGKRG
jgi:DnaJ family protein A protein 5